MPVPLTNGNEIKYEKMYKKYWMAKSLDMHQRVWRLPKTEKILAVVAKAMELHVAQILFLILKKKKDQW